MTKAKHTGRLFLDSSFHVPFFLIGNHKLYRQTIKSLWKGQEVTSSYKVRVEDVEMPSLLNV